MSVCVLIAVGSVPIYLEGDRAILDGTAMHVLLCT
jgi:hypothetical protein